MRRWLLAGVLFASGCYQPSVESCLYACASGAEPCPSGFSCSNGRCAAEGDTCTTTDGSMPDDAGFFGLTWDNATALSAFADANKCERRPILDPSRTYLVVARPTGTVVTAQDCLATAALQLYRWNNGAPGLTAGPAMVESSPLVVGTYLGDGARAGLAAGHLVFIYRTDVGAGNIQLKRADLSGDLQQLFGNTVSFGNFAPNSEVTFDAPMNRIVYTDSGDLYEGTGSVAGGFSGSKIAELSSDAELDLTPTMSPDGRVIVFVRTMGGSGGTTDLFVSRRQNVTDRWSTPQPLPNGPVKINSAAYEYDPFITSDGDLLFTSTRVGDGTRRRVFLARHL